MSCFLGVDAGTQSVKALVYDGEERKVVATESARLDLISRDDGAREQLAEWWLYALRQALAKIDPQIRKRVVAMGVAGQQHGFVPVDADGKPLAPVKLWCDTATETECEEIMTAFGGARRCLEELGNLILPGYTASKIRWLKKHNPHAYQRLATILLPHDYINFHLTGHRRMEYGDASGTGLLDIRKRQWHRGMLAAVDANRDLAECLPPFNDAAQPCGSLLPAVAQELGLQANIVVSAGGGDNMMAAIGTGNVGNGRMTVSLGTSATMFACSSRPMLDEQGELAAFCSSTGAWLPLLCTMNCTVATEQVRNLLKLSITEMEALLRAAPVGSQGIVTLPFYNGERTPSLPNGKACLFGLDATNMSDANLLRSAMEAVTYGLRLGQTAFARIGCEPNEIRLTGGGAKSPVWRQMVADVLRKPVLMLESDEGAALGAALQSMWVYAGANAPLQTLVDEHLVIDATRCTAPDEKTALEYDPHYQRYRSFVALVTPLYR
jgi:xylulokinase